MPFRVMRLMAPTEIRFRKTRSIACEVGYLLPRKGPPLFGYEEVKTRLFARQEDIPSRTPEGVRQELWDIAIVYNLVRTEMERAAAQAPRAHRPD